MYAESCALLSRLMTLHSWQKSASSMMGSRRRRLSDLNRLGIGQYSELTLYVCRKLRFVVPLDDSPFLAKIRIFNDGLETAQPFNVADPCRANTRGEQFRQALIAKHHPSAGGDPVRLVREFLGSERIKIMQ